MSFVQGLKGSSGQKKQTAGTVQTLDVANYGTLLTYLLHGAESFLRS